MITSPELSIVIPAYNEENYIGDCLRSVIKDTLQSPFPCQIIVIDNASTDGTAALVKSFPEVTYVFEPNKGLTHARRAGLQSAHAPIVAFVDADTRMPSGWLRKVRQHFVDDSNVVCVSGPYRYFDVSPLLSVGIWISWHFIAYPMYMIVGYMAVGGNFAISREAMLKVGGFDTSISFYGEDTDIARRISTVGKSLFILSLVMPTSGRRLNAEGAISTGFRYLVNFISIVWVKKPASHTYQDIR